MAIFQNDFKTGGVVDRNGRIILEKIETKNYRGETVFEGIRIDHLRLDSECRVVSLTDYPVEFFDLNGKPIEALNTPKYRLASGFNSDCLSLVLISGTDKWGRVHRNGRLYPLSGKVLEPYFDTWSRDYATLAYPGGKFIPVITHDRNLAYVDEAGKIALTTRKIAEADADILVVQDPDGRELWRHSCPKDTLIETAGHRAFLNPGNLEFGYKPPTAESMKKLVESLQAETPGMFSLYHGYLDRKGDDYYGTGRALAYLYYDEFDYGYWYCYVLDLYSFDKEFLAVRDVLEKNHGAPMTEDEIDWDLFEALKIDYAEDYDAIWQLDNSFLFLEKFNNAGDSDYFRSGINIMLLPSRSSARRE